jgi:hypothetical protein
MRAIKVKRPSLRDRGVADMNPEVDYRWVQTQRVARYGLPAHDLASPIALMLFGQGKKLGQLLISEWTSFRDPIATAQASEIGGSKIKSRVAFVLLNYETNIALRD